MQPAQGFIGQKGLALPEDDLIEKLAGLDHHGEGSRADLDIKRTAVTFRHAVEGNAMVGDDPRQQIKPPDRGFRAGRRGHASGKRDALDQWDDINAPFFEHRAAFEIDLVHLEIRQTVADGAAATGKERCTDAVCGAAKAQVKRSRLDLVVADGAFGGDPAGGDHVPDLVVRQDAGHCHRISPDTRTPAALAHRRAIVVGRASRTRTCDLPSPRRTRYQAAL